MQHRPGSYSYRSIMETCRPCERCTCHDCEHYDPGATAFGTRVHARALGHRDRELAATAKTVEQLMAKAEGSTTFRGHELRPWIVDGTRAHTSCIECGMYVNVDTSPPPNGIDIGGSAVAMTCEG